MGKKRITQVSEVKKQTPEKKDKVHIAGLAGGQRIKAVEAEPEALTNSAETGSAKPAKKTTKKAPKIRGKKYQQARTKIDPNKTYSLSEGIKLLKETSITKFNGSAEVHFVLVKTGIKGEVELPHLEAKSQKVEIANDDTLKKLEAGKIDFDVLLSSPTMMPQLAKYAKMLGPKGLMPNPKSGTITENPEKMAKEFAKPQFSFKTEADAPLIHTIFGKASQSETELEANLSALIKAIGSQNIKKVVIKSTMGPAIKINL